MSSTGMAIAKAVRQFRAGKPSYRLEAKGEAKGGFGQVEICYNAELKQVCKYETAMFGTMH